MNQHANDDAPLSADEQAAEWCLRLAEDDLGLIEQREFDAWHAEPDNAAAFADAIAVWQSADAAAEQPEIIHIRSQALESFRQANSRRWTRKIVRRWRWPVGAVAAILLAILTTSILFQDATRIYETGIGERQVAILEDGSKVSLDAATRVEVTLADDGRELVLVAGRAKFDVAKDPLRPFSVSAGDKVVVATGTSFSVELLDKQTRVVLYEGQVEVLDQAELGEAPRAIRIESSGQRRTSATLTPGRELIALAGRDNARIVPIDTQRASSWEAGQISFDDEPLTSAVQRMNRYAESKLVVGDTVAARVRVNGVFDAGDTEAFVEGLTALDKVRVSRSEGQLTLRGK